jgi:diacylglycerol O-acyltransferase
MLEAFPFVPLGGSVRVGIAIFSYDGNINFGVTGDRDSAPDIAVLCRGIEAAMDELRARSTTAPSSPPAKGSASRTQQRRASGRSPEQAETKLPQ